MNICGGGLDLSLFLRFSSCYCIMVGCTIIIVGKETMRDLQYVEYVEYVMTRLSC